MPKRRYRSAKRKRTGRKRKSFFRGFLFSAIVFVSILILSAAGFLLFSPKFQISNIIVTGNGGVAAEDIKSAAEGELKKTFSIMGMDFTTESIFLSIGNGVSALAEAFPEIQSVSIKRDFPNGLSIEVTEKTPFAVWCEEYAGEKCYLVDKPGTYVKDYDSSSEPGGLIKVYEREKISSMQKKEMLSYLEKIKAGAAGELSISDFNIYEDKVVVDTASSCKLMFVLDDTINWQIEKLGIVMKNGQYSEKLSTLSYIDLRFGNQAIIK